MSTQNFDNKEFKKLQEELRKTEKEASEFLKSIGDNAAAEFARITNSIKEPPFYFAAVVSISIKAPIGRSFTANVTRAGLLSE